MTHYLTHLRTYAIMMVVLLHVAAPVRDRLEYMATLNWFVGALFDGAARMGVPLFVMISGALLLGKEEGIWTFYRKRFMRLAVPLLVWGLFYAWWWQYTVEHKWNLRDAIVGVFQGPAYYHLWYLYMLVGLYLVTPFIQILASHISKKQLETLLILWGIFSIVLPHLYAHLALWVDIRFHLGFSLHGVDLYLGYYLLGFYLHRHAVPQLRSRTYWGIYFGATLVMVAASWVVYWKSKVYNPLMVLNESPFVLVQAVMLFLAFRSSKAEGTSIWSKASIQIAAVSFGIYLVHPVIIDILDRGYLGFELDARQMDTILSIPLTFPVVLGVSWLFCYGISKVPVVKRVIG